MKKSLANKNHQHYLALLRRIRTERGLRQREIAERLGQPQSFVSKYESGERRLDLLELEQVCAACDTDLVSFVSRYRGEV